MLAGYDRMMLENKKKLDEERGKRAELENRLALTQAELARRPLPAEGRPQPAGAAAGVQPAAGKAMDCTLRPGSIGDTLKGCLEEFNR